jgi:hypothetical protein
LNIRFVPKADKPNGLRGEVPHHFDLLVRERPHLLPKYRY